ncbi:MAG: NAD-dependent epimerase/dehydratase family protein [Bacteroidales bacterium]|nr:NAD-dependent epimerase/dehydratase family protein [Bacteroidales bacterium]
MILVTGATGILGAHLLLNLLKLDQKVVAIYRNISSIEKTKKIFSFYVSDYQFFFDKIIWRQADITNYFDVIESFEGVDQIYHCAAHVSIQNHNKDRFYQTNVVGTANIVNASLEKNIHKLCYVSSIATISLNTTGLTSEENFINPEQASTYYSLTKYYAELEVWRGIKEGLNAVIVNPSVIVAPYLLNSNGIRFLKYFYKRGIKHHTCGKKGYISVYDLVEVMQKLMDSNISDERFLVSSENLSFKTLFFYFNKITKKKIKSKKLSVSMLNFLRYLNILFTFGKPIINKVLISYAINDELYTSKKLFSKISIDFEPIEKTMNKILALYKQKYLL